MAHAQQQVLDAVRAALVLAATVAGARVFVDRVDPLQASELPAILVDEDGEGESREVSTIHSTLHQAELAVAVRCVVRGGAGAAAAARALGLQAELALVGSLPLNALVTQGPVMTGSRQNNTGDADALMAAREQSWRFGYYLNPSDPETLL